MGKKATVVLRPGDEPDKLRAEIELKDQELLGKAARLEIFAHVEVDDHRPVNNKRLLVSHKFKFAKPVVWLRIPIKRLRAYSYTGADISIEIKTRLTVDDSILFDTKISERQQLELRLKPEIQTNAKQLIDPRDRFSFFDNLKAIPFKAQVITFLLLIAGAITVTVNTIVGVHDQMSPERGTWFYSQVDSEGESQSPLFQSLALSGGLGAGIWFLLRKQLRKYMTFRFRPRRAPLRRGRRYRLSNLIQGRPRVDLRDVRIRVVACNMECGQYKRGSGTDVRTVSFAKPVRAVLLYDKRIPLIRASSSVAQYVGEELSFDPMFDALYPPLMVGEHHGLKVRWEVQLLHGQFIDQELVGPIHNLLYQDFMRATDSATQTGHTTAV